jgi:hypothetical protein
LFSIDKRIIMHTALRPFMTTGIAIAGAGILVAAPVTVLPHGPQAVEVAAPVAAVRQVTVDVELTALIDALIVAMPEAVVGTAQFLFETVPGVVLADFAAGRFAHAVAIAILLPAVAYSVPLAPIVAAFASELPLPLGTFDGVLNQGLYLINSIPSIPVEVILLLAEVIDGNLSPADFPAAALNAITNRLNTAVQSFQQIIAAIGGALPLSTLAVSPQELPPFAVEEAPAESTHAENFSSNAAAVPPDAPLNTVTLDVETAAAGHEASAASGPVESEPESEEQPLDTADDDETPNGGTDLSDGNLAEPGVTAVDPADGEADGSGMGTEPDTVIAGEDDTEQTATTDTVSADPGRDAGTPE